MGGTGRLPLCKMRTIHRWPCSIRQCLSVLNSRDKHLPNLYDKSSEEDDDTQLEKKEPHRNLMKPRDLVYFQTMSLISRRGYLGINLDVLRILVPHLSVGFVTPRSRRHMTAKYLWNASLNRNSSYLGFDPVDVVLDIAELNSLTSIRLPASLH
jgi:hypothetical protein